LSGLEVQQCLARQEPCPPCIVITGKDEPGAGQRVLAAGAAAYLTKPLDAQVLLGAIKLAVPEPVPYTQFENRQSQRPHVSAGMPLVVDEGQL
jgi:AmiR/NasT family two-component response regulator